MTVKLVCTRCGAALAPTLSGPRCPRLAACGRGGYVETLHPALPLTGLPERGSAWS